MNSLAYSSLLLEETQGRKDETYAQSTVDKRACCSRPTASAADGRLRESGVSSAKRKRKGDCERLDEEARGETQTHVGKKGDLATFRGIKVYDRLARRTNPGLDAGQNETRVEKVARGVAVN